MSPLRPAGAACLALLLSTCPLLAQTSLADRIDQAIRNGRKDYDKAAAPLAGDAEFLRRIYLDLTGVIPAPKEVRAFLADSAPDRRRRLIDRLLASDGYARQMQQVFDVLLMDRRPGKHVKEADWQEFLRTSFAANKPYDQLVREILSADGSDPKTRALARFYLDREGEPNQVTKDLSRLFLGMNLNCAQCHDHPLVTGYRQDFYYGIFAFLNRSYLVTDKAKKVSVLAEKAEGEVSFQSVFVPKVSKSTGPHLPGQPPLKEPKFEKGQEYLTPVKQGERGVPKFSRRAQLAAALTSPENARFTRSVVNRLWSLYLGRGLIHPVEYDHDANPPSHPELLNLLAEEFRAQKYDLKALVRAIVLSETYQRSSELPREGKERDPAWFAAAPLRPLSPEQLAWSLMQATGHLDAERQSLGPKGSEAALYARVGGQAAPVIKLFASPPGEPAVNHDFEATLDQTLFLSNSELLRTWLTPRSGNLTDRLASLKDAAEVAEELYVSVLSRRPTTEESAEVADYLRRRAAERPAALQELAWALLASGEFRFNH